MIILDIDQGSDGWYKARCGVITMSNAKALITGGKGVTRRSYLLSVAAEIITGKTADNYQSWKMQRGTAIEPFARAAYAMETGIEAREVGFVYYDNKARIGCSPDGITDIGGIEIKCPNAAKHLTTILADEVPDEYLPQIQGCIWVCGVDAWDFVSFCPEFTAQPLFIKRVYKDSAIISKIRKSAIEGVAEIDAAVKAAHKQYQNKKAWKHILQQALLISEEDEQEITL